MSRFLSPGLAGALALLSFLPRIQESTALTWSFRFAAGGLVAWAAALLLARKRFPGIDVSLRRHHYIQAAVQLAVFGYWGWYWRPVYDFAWLLVGQLLFAYGFGALLAWSRGRRYALGFGPFPIIFSINLFLWFRDDWFYLQFLMIAAGFLGKELVRWERDGVRRHIFNPSAFTLGLFSVALIVTGTSDLTWGREIASTLTLAPGIYLFLFLAGLVVMYFFSITLIVTSGAAVLFGLSAAYMAWAGVPYFVDSEIPAAVFLGLHLLITDPATSPRTPPGKVVFGASYGVGVFVLYALLGWLGAPTFYDKLLCVPLLNLSVRGIDSAVRSARPVLAPLRTTVAGIPLGTNVAHMALWMLFFAAMTASGRTDGRHVGDPLPFWQTACEDGRRGACDRLVALEETYCRDNSSWACNELGGHHALGRFAPQDAGRALAYFGRACELRSQAACANLLEPGTFRQIAPKPLDLRLLLREGGRNLMEASEEELLARACAHGWSFACGGLDAGARPDDTSRPPTATPTTTPTGLNRDDFLTAIEARAPLGATGAKGVPSSDPGAAGSSGPGGATAARRPDAQALPTDFVEVPSGPFLMGSDPRLDPASFENERWSDTGGMKTVELPAFMIGRREVTIAQFAAFARATGAPVHDSALAGPSDHPVAFVSWPDALAFARWVEARLRSSAGTPEEVRALLEAGYRVRLPTEAEWEKGARGTDGRVYPWGNTFRRDRATFGTVGTAPVGAVRCPECPYGLDDMGGNVWEWTTSPYRATPTADAALPSDLAEDALWIMRGGSFADDPRTVRAAVRGAAEPGARRAFIGFRLVIARRLDKPAPAAPL